MEREAGWSSWFRYDIIATLSHGSLLPRVPDPLPPVHPHRGALGRYVVLEGSVGPWGAQKEVSLRLCVCVCVRDGPAQILWASWRMKPPHTACQL